MTDPLLDNQDPADLDHVTEAVREAVVDGLGEWFDRFELVGTRVTGRAGEFELTLDHAHYLIIIERVEDNE